MNRPFALLSAILLVLIPGLAIAQTVNQPVPAPPSYEYVQQASSLQYDGQSLTLQGVAPSTIFFSDHPYRLTGQVDTATFANLWTAPNGPFASNPPNAAISVLGQTGVSPAIVELTSATADGANVTYGVKVLSGEVPASAENIALFVDHGPRPVNGVHYYPYHPIPGPYCYHAPQAPECHYRPYHPYHPYHPYYPYPYYHPGAAFAAGAAVGAAAASKPTTVYVYPLPSGPLPAQCHINSNHTRMICSVPISQQFDKMIGRARSPRPTS